MLPLVGGASLRCRWEVEAPFSGHVEQGPLKLSQPRGLPGVGCTWHGFAVDRPVWIRRLGSRLLVLGSHLPAHPFELLQPPQGPEMWCQTGTRRPQEYIRYFFLSFPHLTFIFYWHLGDLIIALVWGELQLHFLFPVALWTFYCSFPIKTIPEQPAELPVNIWFCICHQCNSLIPSFYLSPFVTKGFLFYSGALYVVYKEFIYASFHILSINDFVSYLSLSLCSNSVSVAMSSSIMSMQISLCHSSSHFFLGAEWESRASMDRNSCIVPVSKNICVASVILPKSRAAPNFGVQVCWN